MVVFDTSILVLAFDASSNPPRDPGTGNPLVDCHARVTHLIKRLSDAKERIVIPTPVLAEYLVRAGTDRASRLAEMTGSRAFVVAPFDIRAAVECAALEDGDTSNARPLTEGESKAKVKFDRQINAIAIVRGANTIYTGDIGLAASARRNGLRAIMTWEIDLPPASPQLQLPYGDSA